MIVGVGCDLVDMKRLVSNQESLAKRVLTTTEYNQYIQYSENRKLEFLAGHFALKEALVKANPKPSLISDYEIYYVDSKPHVDVKGYRVHVSIAHDNMMAQAIAIIESGD